MINDHRARVIAEHNQIERIGALGLLLIAKRRGIINMLTPYVSKLRQSSIFYGNDLLDKVLIVAGTKKQDLLIEKSDGVRTMNRAA